MVPVIYMKCFGDVKFYLGFLPSYLLGLIQSAFFLPTGLLFAALAVVALYCQGWPFDKVFCMLIFFKTMSKIGIIVIEYVSRKRRFGGVIKIS